MSWIIGMIDPACREEAVAGGKGASLARLQQLGVNIPSFFVIPIRAFREMTGVTFPAEFLDELRAALACLNPNVKLAVRSSAIGEDSAENSFAGLYQTVLNVSGFDEVVSALRECWKSYQDVAAQQYRRERDHNGFSGGMGVVIQEMVQAEWAGVCFTANPVTMALSTGIINGVQGLGEALVSGSVNPEEITLSTADGKIIDRRGGKATAEVPQAIVDEVWHSCQKIAEELKFPQDIEWAWSEGKLAILQSRPITTIADVFYSRYLEPWSDHTGANPDDPGRVWSRMMADETWVSPISPLFYCVHNLTMARIGFIRAHGDKRPIPVDIFKYHLATAYADVRMIRRVYEFQPKLARLKAIVNFLPLDQQREFRNAPWHWRGRFYRILSYELKQRQTRSFFENYRRVQAQWPDYVAKSNQWLEIDLDALSLNDLRAHQAMVAKEMSIVSPQCGIAVFNASDIHLLLTGLLERWCKNLGSDGENLYARVSAGLDDSETVKESDALFDLSMALRELGEGAQRDAENGSWKEFREALSTRYAGQRFIEEFELFWRDHRHLGSTYKDVIWPRWGDDIDQCFDVLKSYLHSSAKRPSEVNARSAEARRRSQKEILNSLRGPLAAIRRGIFRFLFRYNEIYMSVRDNHRYYVDRNWYELRRIYLSYGARLVAAKALRSPEDVFFLGVSEVDQALEGTLDGSEAMRRIEVRRRVWERTLHRQGPKFLKGWAPYDELVRGEPSDSAELSGIGASPGVAVGLARIVYDVRELSKVKDREILVTRQTDPSWTMVFGRISGLVLETGGVLSHGTSLCREYGLPCVTAVERATVRIPDGSLIELVGSEGSIKILRATSRDANLEAKE